MKNSKKIIFVLFLISILVLLRQTDDKIDKNISDDSFNDLVKSQKLSEEELDKLSASLDKDIKVGELESLDTDNDGSYDKFVLTLAKEEVAEDLFLEKIIKYERIEEGFMGTLILEFENTGDETKTYSHRENIPKSFAVHIDDLEFSIPTTEIVNPDPEVAWIIEVINRNIKRITIKAKVVATSAAVKADPGKALAIMLTGMSDVPSEKMIKAGKDAAIGVVFDNLSSFVFIKALSDCSKFEESLWNTCLVNLMVKSPDMFIESDCEKIDIDYSDAMNYTRGPVLYGMCKAIMTKDWNECHENADIWKEVDMCKQIMFKSFSGNCEYIKDKEKKDECIYNATIKSNSMYGCKDIANKITQNGCFAELTQEITYCEGINDKDTKKYCCDKIVDDGAKKECFEGGKKKEEDTFSVGFDCPIPAGAIHKVISYHDKWVDNNGRSVGLDQFFYDYKRERIRTAICYNAEGEAIGISKQWRNNGTLKRICTYENGTQSCEDIPEPVDDTPFVPIGNKACAEREKNCNGTNPLSAFANTEISAVSCKCINNKIITCTDDQCSEMTAEKKELICLSLRDRCLNPMIDQAVMWEYGFKCDCIGNVIVSCTDGMCE